MANEAVLVYETSHPIPFTVADGAGIEKGALLKLTDPMTAVITSGSGDMIAGIASTEKIASDGVTKLGVFRRGIFKMTASGSITAGQPLASAGGVAGDVNKVYAPIPSAALSGSSILGTALETASTGETFLVDLNVGTGGAT